jgi:hypothetical protein
MGEMRNKYVISEEEPEGSRSLGELICRQDCHYYLKTITFEDVD